MSLFKWSILPPQPFTMIITKTQTLPCHWEPPHFYLCKSTPLHESKMSFSLNVWCLPQHFRYNGMLAPVRIRVDLRRRTPMACSYALKAMSDCLQTIFLGWYPLHIYLSPYRLVELFGNDGSAQATEQINQWEISRGFLESKTTEKGWYN